MLWRLVFKPGAFFTEIGDARDLSWRNAASFCLATTAVLAFGVYGGGSVIVALLVGYSAQPWLSGLVTVIVLWIALYVALVVAGVVSATVNVCSGALIGRRFSFRRLAVSSLYVNTLILVLNVGVLLVGFGLHALQNSKVGGGGPSVPNQVVDVLWIVVQAIWGYVLVPALVLLAAVRATGVRPARLFLAELGFCALAAGVVLTLLFVAHVAAA